MHDPGRYRQAVLGVYKNLIRYSKTLDSSLSKKISRQFRRYQKNGNIGHLRAGYMLEEQLRAVHQGNMQLSELKQEWKQSKQKPLEELNAVGRRKLWSLQPERAWDEFNNVELCPKNSRMSIRQSNLRARYMRKHNITKDTADPIVIDTVFAPLWQASIHPDTISYACRYVTPPKVSVHTVVRSGGELSVLRVQGRKPRAKGFSRHIAKVFCANGNEERYKSLEVHRRILINRAANIRRNMIYWHQHKLNQKPNIQSAFNVRFLPGLTTLPRISTSKKP